MEFRICSSNAGYAGERIVDLSSKQPHIRATEAYAPRKCMPRPKECMCASIGASVLYAYLES